MTVKTKV